MAQQTAVGWFINNIPNRFRNAILNTCSKEIDQANKMFEQQIEDAVNYGDQRGKIATYRTAEQYYNETYKNK